MKQITKIRKAVATMANELRKLGYTLSNAWKTAWRRIKEGITVKAAGVTFDKYAVAVVVGIKGIGYAHIGYLPNGIAQSVAAILDNGMELQADVKVIGGFGYKENYGALVSIEI